MIVSIGDFTGKYELHTGIYDQSKITAYIAKYEPRYMRELLGAQLYEDFVSDIDQQSNEPKSPNFQTLYNPFAVDVNLYRILESEGIKEMLIGFLYFEYIKDTSNTITPFGNTVSRSELSKLATSLQSLMYNRYNESVRTFMAIREYIVLNWNDFPLGQAVSSQITTVGNGYISASNVTPVALSGIVKTLSIASAGTGYATNNGVATSGGSGTGLTVDYTDNGSGGVLSVTIDNYGSGYKAGDVVTIIDGNDDCTLTITSASQLIAGSGLVINYTALPIGEIINQTLLTAGSGYVTATQVPTTGGSGNGCIVNIQDDGAGGVLSMTIFDGGTGYLVGETLTIDAGNQDATFIIANIHDGEVDQILITTKGSGYAIGDEFLILGGSGTAVFELDYVGIGDISLYNGREKLYNYWI
jgi:hypothetical protein